jgi:hypothetical protein
VAAAGLAEEQPESECEEGACECCPEPKRWIVTGGLDYATDYVFRGYRLQSGGLILQPFVTAAYAHHVSDDITLTPYLTLWQSFDLDGAEEVELPSLSLVALGHCFGLVEGSTTRLHTATHQLELYGGVVTQIGDLTLDGKYMLDSASGESFSSMQEIGLKVGYDLAGLWTDEPAAARTFGLRPTAGFYFETVDHRGGEDAYLELGLEPFWRCELWGARVGLSLPATLGFSLDDYYFDAQGRPEALGYFAIGPTVSVPLGLPPQYGTWFFTASMKYWHLAAENLVAINGGQNDRLVGQAGLGFAF